MGKYLILGFSLTIYFILWIVMMPYYGYMLDADAVGYLSITQRILHNDFANSINGLWSPLHSWLIIPFAKCGIPPFTAAMGINTFFGGIVIIMVFYLFEFFNIKKYIQNSALLMLPILIVYYSYIQVFADLPQLAFLLIYLYIVIQPQFIRSLPLHILSAIIIGIAYYAKSYSLIFYVLHLTATHILYFIKTKEKYMLNYVVGIITTLLVILPWTFALQQKYGTFNLTGNAGKLNMSWYMMSHKYLKPELGHLIPPPYPNSPSFWEDPYFAQEKLLTPFTNSTTFIRWVFRIVHTSINSVICMNEISCFCIIILCMGIYIYFIKHKSFNPFQILVIATICIIAGYLTIHIETRYIWLIAMLSLVIGAKFLSDFTFEKKWIAYTTVGLFMLSYIVYPLYHLEIVRNKGKDNFQLAATMQQHHLKGRWTSNTFDAGNWWVVAYLTQTQFYTIEDFNFTKKELYQELQEDKIDFIAIKNENTVFNELLDSTTSTLLFKQGDISLYKMKYTQP